MGNVTTKSEYLAKQRRRMASVTPGQKPARESRDCLKGRFDDFQLEDGELADLRQRQAEIKKRERPPRPSKPAVGAGMFDHLSLLSLVAMWRFRKPPQMKVVTS